MYKIGLIVNPIAGIGGAVGLKGSDGSDIVVEALSRGAVPQAGARALTCLKILDSVKDQLHFFSCPGAMGADVFAHLDYIYSVLPMEPTGEADAWVAADTEHAVKLMSQQSLDLILFVGGDGTARNIFNGLNEAGIVDQQLVLGIPAGVKIHSGVYGVNPEGAGEVVRELVTGEIVSLVSAEVRDIDEVAFREGRVNTTYFGELKVPAEASYMQQVKNSGREVEALVLQEIATYVIEIMEEDVYYVIGPGSTTKSITDELGLAGTLLGVDVVFNNSLVAKDVTESALFDLIADQPVRLIITAIGGQGHILGRGNQQLSPRVIRCVEEKHIWVVATKNKLKELENRPLLVDSGDPQLDDEFYGFIPVITGYEENVIYQVGLKKVSR